LLNRHFKISLAVALKSNCDSSLYESFLRVTLKEKQIFQSGEIGKDVFHDSTDGAIWDMW
jgi:hypothetical protein